MTQVLITILCFEEKCLKVESVICHGKTTEAFITEALKDASKGYRMAQIHVNKLGDSLIAAMFCC